MPKDNEVDEKAENWDYCRDLRIAVTDGKNGARATLNGHGAPAGISLYHGDYVAELKTEAAASAATVAELRAEVAKARISGIDACDKLTTLWQKDIDRADAAERRVGELERACKPIIEKSIAISKKTSSVFTSDLRRLLAALTGASAK